MKNSERTKMIINYKWFDEHLRLQYWHCGFSTYLKHYTLFNADFRDFSENLRAAFRALGYKEVDEGFLSAKQLHRTDKTLKSELLAQITNDCVLLDLILVITLTDYYYFNLHLPEFAMNACKNKCSDVGICKLLVQ